MLLWRARPLLLPAAAAVADKQFLELGRILSPMTSPATVMTWKHSCSKTAGPFLWQDDSLPGAKVESAGGGGKGGSSETKPLPSKRIQVLQALGTVERAVRPPWPPVQKAVPWRPKCHRPSGRPPAPVAVVFLTNLFPQEGKGTKGTRLLLPPPHAAKHRTRQVRLRRHKEPAMARGGHCQTRSRTSSQPTLWTPRPPV